MDKSPGQTISKYPHSAKNFINRFKLSEYFFKSYLSWLLIAAEDIHWIHLYIKHEYEVLIARNSLDTESDPLLFTNLISCSIILDLIAEKVSSIDFLLLRKYTQLFNRIDTDILLSLVSAEWIRRICECISISMENIITKIESNAFKVGENEFSVFREKLFFTRNLENCFKIQNTELCSKGKVFGLKISIIYLS